MTNLVKIKQYYRHSPKGKTITVKSHYQRRKTNRGNIKETHKNPPKGMYDTYWLKDRKGYFKGRANVYKETTTPKPIIKSAGQDATGNIQEKKTYGRVFGRYKTEKPSRKRNVTFYQRQPN